jgi:AcrR family transcriptional regulator
MTSAQPGTRGFLNAKVIAQEARAIAETEGLDAVSMRALADRLQCTPRALYRHVADKHALLEMLADGAFAELPEPQVEATWQDAYMEYFTAMRKLLVSTPAVAMIIAQQAVAGENFRRHMDRLVGVMTSAGFDGELAVEAVVALSYYTLGASLPGTGQDLHDTYDVRQDDVSDEELPVLKDLMSGFAQDSAEQQFRNALQHLIRGYSVDA